MSEIVPASPPAPAQFEAMLAVLAGTVAAPATASAYAGDLADWCVWCDGAGHDPAWPVFRAVVAYINRLADLGAGRGTLRRRVAALRKLAQIAYALEPTPQRRAALESLSPTLLKVNVGHTEEREKHALAPEQVEQVLAAWDGATLQGARNKAMMAVLFCAGLRRAEIAALRWDDVDRVAGLITVRHGKGDKARVVPVYGPAARRAVLAWWAALEDGRVYAFPRMYKGDAVGPDAPITARGVYYVVCETARAAGLRFRPHDARRTFITERLLNGAPLADVQADAGHAQASTTLVYAQAADAIERQARGRLRYG